MGFLERLFQNNEKEVDSIYERRKERGEVSEPAIAHLNMRRNLEEQKKIVRDLLKENMELRKELDAAKEELKRNQFIHSMDDLIEAMKQQPSKGDCIYNPFAAYMRTANFGTSSGSDDGSMYGTAFEPDQYCDVPDDAEFGDMDTDIDDIGDER